MAHFFVTIGHPDQVGWVRHLKPHLDWILAQVESGCLLASGPTVGTVPRGGALIFRTEDLRSLQDILDTDPFFIEGMVADVMILEWDPIFGAFQPDSSGLTYTDLLGTFT